MRFVWKCRKPAKHLIISEIIIILATLFILQPFFWSTQALWSRKWCFGWCFTAIFSGVGLFRVNSSWIPFPPFVVCFSYSCSIPWYFIIFSLLETCSNLLYGTRKKNHFWYQTKRSKWSAQHSKVQRAA